MPDHELVETQRALIANWGMTPAPVTEDDLNRRLILGALVERITHLFKHDYNRLLTALYMLDVPEGRYRTALAQPELAGKAQALAELILERETARVRTWLYYAEQKRRANAPRAVGQDATDTESGGQEAPS